MEMRDRLIDTLVRHWFDGMTMGECADMLLANGVIVPPCNVGDTVYVPWNWAGEYGVAVVCVEELKIYDNKNHCMFFIDMQSDDEDYNQAYGGWKIGKSIGETVFLTKEEAENALKEHEGNG